MPSAPERLSRVDTAWLRMDTPANLMMIVGVWRLHPGIRREALVARVEERLLAYPRFRQKVVEDALGAAWVEDPDFDLGHHLRRETLPATPGGPRRALQDRVAALATEPLDPHRPRWQLHLVEDCPLEDGRPGSALIARIHHCIADGIALIAVMLSMTDEGAPPPARRPRRGRRPGNPGEAFMETLLRPMTDLTVKAIGLGGEGLARSLELLAQPTQPLLSSLEMARAGGQVLADAAALALMPDDAPTRLKGSPGPRKGVAWCDPLPLDAVKAVGKALGASVNDVLLSCAAGALGDYLRAQGDDPRGQEIRAMVPVNLRPLDRAHELGNRFGLVPLLLPIGVANPVARLEAVRARMRALKGSTQPLLAFGVLALAGLLIKPAQQALLGLFARKATAVMTNVPGPARPLTVLGTTLEQVMFWVPQSGDIGLGVSILSYGGGVQFGLIADAGLCPEPQALVDGFGQAFEALTLATLMMPWGEPG